MIAAEPMTAHRKAFVLRLVPAIHAAPAVQPGLEIDLVVGEHGERWHAVFAVVLELIVAPDDAEIGLEFIEGAPRPAKPLDHFPAMGVGVGMALVRAPLPAHRLRPILDRTQPLRQRRVRQACLDAGTEVALNRKAGIMSDAKPEYLSHDSSSLGAAQSWGPTNLRPILLSLCYTSKSHLSRNDPRRWPMTGFYGMAALKQLKLGEGRSWRGSCW